MLSPLALALDRSAERNNAPQVLPAEVVHVRPAGLIATIGPHPVEVRSAVLDYDPAPGDQILVIGDEATGYYAIGVLATARPRPKLKVETSESSGATVLSVENGDLEVVAPHGAVRVVSSSGFEATTMGPLRLESLTEISASIRDRLSGAVRRLSLSRRAVEVQHEQVNIHAGRFEVAAGEGRLQGENLELRVGSLAVIARRVSSELGSLLTKIDNAFHRVAGLWQLAARRTRMVVEETSHHQAQRLYSKAEDVKVKADKIHLG